MKPPTFAEIYCEREKLAPSDLSHVLFRRSLYPHARLFAWLVRKAHPSHFLPDDEFVEDVGHLQSLEDFALALGSYLEHPANWSLLRRTFRIRISGRRMLDIVRTVYSADCRKTPVLPPGRHTLDPFAQPPDDSRDSPATGEPGLSRDH